VKSLNQLNDKLSANNMTALSVDASGLLKISASNDFASSTLGSATFGGTLGGTLKDSLTFTTAEGSSGRRNAQATRAGLVPSTTRSSIRSTRPRRTRPSTASTCSTATR
jgi:flagellin